MESRRDEDTAQRWVELAQQVAALAKLPRRRPGYISPASVVRWSIACDVVFARLMQLRADTLATCVVSTKADDLDVSERPWPVEPPGMGTLCSVCGWPQRQTPSGATCPEGHGGAPPLEPGATPAQGWPPSYGTPF